MAPRLKVGGKDLSPYLRMQPEDGMDPLNSAYFRPQFQGVPALGEGQSWTSDAIDNRTMTIPLYLTANSRAEMKALGQEINALLVKGTQIEFAIDPTIDPISYFDLERGSLSEEFNYYHQINTVQACTLTLVCRPYANTATKRLVASLPMASSAAVMFPATGILGDAAALANLEVRVGSAVASAGRVIAWGLHPHPSHLGYRAATSGLAQTGATVLGASGAISSQYTAIPISPTGASGTTYTQYFDPPDAHTGRHRLIAVGRSGLSGPITMYAEDRFGAVLGATVQATQIDTTKWQFIDLGEINIPTRASGQDAVPTQYVNLRAGGASGYSMNSSPAFHLNGLALIPLDYSAGILRTAGAQSNPLLFDAFKRFTSFATLESQPQLEVGGAWSHVSGELGVGPLGGVAGPAPLAVFPANTKGEFAQGATGRYAAASGQYVYDVVETLPLQLLYASESIGSFAGAMFELWPKAISNASTVTDGIGVKLTMSPSHSLSVWLASGSATSLLASAGIASTLASGMYLNQAHTLTVKSVGPRLDVWLATGALSASPVLSASRAAIAAGGWPIVGGAQASSIFALVAMGKFAAYQAASVPLDIGAREWFRFEAHPQGRAYQGNASIFVADRLGAYRGQYPKIPNVGSPMATGPARVTVLSGEIDNIVGNDGFNIGLAVLERFRYLR